MKYTLTFISFFIAFFIAKAQCDYNKVLDIKNIKMKSEKKLDTFYFYARIFSLNKPAQQDFLDSLSKLKIIDKANYWCALEFIPIGSEHTYYLPIREEDEFLYGLIPFKLSDVGRQICIRGVKIRDFEIWTWNNEPFFLIDKVWLE